MVDVPNFGRFICNNRTRRRNCKSDSARTWYGSHDGLPLICGSGKRGFWEMMVCNFIEVSIEKFRMTRSTFDKL